MISFVYSSTPFALLHAEDGAEESVSAAVESSASEDTASDESNVTENDADDETDDTVDTVVTEEDENTENSDGEDDTAAEQTVDTEVTETDEEMTEDDTTEEISETTTVLDTSDDTEQETEHEGSDAGDDTEPTEDSDTPESSAMASSTLSVPDQLESTTTATTTATDEEATTTALIGFETTATSTDATTTSTASSESTSSSTASTTIQTGTAVALANILNLVNTNFINSDGVVLFKNFFETLTEDFDLRSMYDALANFGCSLTACTDNEVHTNIQNDAIIDNELYVEAVTGGNTIDTTGTATIDTGDAYAGVNLVNIANTNIIDSNYLLLTMNAFQNVEGDIVFPSLKTFLNSLGNSNAPTALSVTNAGSIQNDVALDANTDNNTVDGASSSTIATGASTAATNVFNQLNTTLAGGQSISIIFRVHGSWAGEIFGAPDNLRWMENGNGGIYLFDESAGGDGNGALEAYATNTAHIRNNVNVVALTGENAISGSETALISTGNAYAGANIMNVANATVVGRNWMLAIVNIFGDFNGNIAFGRPDLWVGGQVTVPNTIHNGSELTYTLTVINNGDSEATNVAVTNTYDTSYLDITSASLPYTTDSANRMVWALPDLEPGEAVEITYTGIVKDSDYNTDINSTVQVAGRETDNNTADNTDILTVTTSSRSSKRGEVRIRPVHDTELLHAAYDTEAIKNAITVERATAVTNVHLNESHSVSQKVTITNTTDMVLRGATFHDFLKDPEDTILHEDIWDLGDIQAYETIEIAYTIDFQTDAPTGIYALDTVMDWDGHQKVFPRNGTVLAWVSAMDTEFAAVPPPSIHYDETSTTTDESFLDIFVPPVAEAAGTLEITRGSVKEKVGPTGILLMLASLMLLYGWHRPEWHIEVRRRLASLT